MDGDVEAVRICMFVNLTIGNSVAIKLQMRMQDKGTCSEKALFRIHLYFSSHRPTHLSELDRPAL